MWLLHHKCLELNSYLEISINSLSKPQRFVGEFLPSEVEGMPDSYMKSNGWNKYVNKNNKINPKLNRRSYSNLNNRKDVNYSCKYLII